MSKIFFVLIFLICICGCALTGSRYWIKYGSEERTTEIESPKKRLPVGERLTYKAEWMGLDVGIITLSVEGITLRNGREVYHVKMLAESTPVISKIYKVRDEISTYIDIEKLYPVRFEKKQREGGYKSDEYIDFNHEKGRAFYFSRLNHSKKEYGIPKGVQDPLSCVYFFRLKDVAIGKSLFANVNADDKNYLLEAKIHKKGMLNVKNVGKWDAFLIEPLPWFQGKVKRKAKVTAWFSSDERRIPLLIVTKGIPFVGSITITLQKIEHLDTISQ